MFNNEPGASFDARSDWTFGWDFIGGIPTFNNLAGATFGVSNDGGGDGTQMGLIFNNDGTVEVNSGSLLLGFLFDASVAGSATSSGEFDGASGTSLGFWSVSQEFTATSSIDAGNVVFVEGEYDVAGSYGASGQTQVNLGATVNFTGTVANVGSSLDIVPSNGNALANFSPAVPTTLATGECTVTGTLTGTDSFVITGALTWSGSLSTTGTIDAEGGITANGGSLQNGTLNNYGAASWSEGNIAADNGAVFNNEPGASFDAQSDWRFGWDFIGGVPTFNNLAGATFGVANDGGGDGTQMGLIFNNDGAVEVNSGSLLLGFCSDACGGRQVATSSGEFDGASGTSLGRFWSVSQEFTADVEH